MKNNLLWGPARPAFTMENPSTYPVFNSITNNPIIGDERNFVRIGAIFNKRVQMQSTIEVVAGMQYLVRIYFHNEASSTYNGPEYKNSGVSTQTKVSSQFSNVVKPNEAGSIIGTIISENANPKKIWCGAKVFSNSGEVHLSYVMKSAKIFNNYATSGSDIPDSLFTNEGTYIGLNKLNGLILGGAEYSGVVSYILQAD